MTQPQRRAEYLTRTGRFHQMVAEGLCAFGVHEGGRDKYTPMAVLDALIAESPDDAPLDAIDMLAGALADASPKHEVMRLRSAGMPPSQIANVLRMPPSSVRGILFRAGMVRGKRC